MWYSRQDEYFKDAATGARITTGIINYNTPGIKLHLGTRVSRVTRGNYVYAQLYSSAIARRREHKSGGLAPLCCTRGLVIRISYLDNAEYFSPN